MRRLETALDHLSEAAEHGRISALNANCLRDLLPCSTEYPGLFPASPFDARLFSTVASANAFGSPWATAAQLRIATRASLWVFAADWAVDYMAKTAEEVEDIVRGCLAVADGAPATSDAQLTRFLADIRAELAVRPAFRKLFDNWRDQLDRYLHAMAREWRWKADRKADPNTPLPTFDDYTANADNFGSSWVNISHWIFTSGPEALAHINELWAASEEVQRILRLLNDLISYERDLEWGDLNSLMLGVDRDEVSERIGALIALSREMIGALKADCPLEASYLERQIGYSMGFYGTTDYWGAL